MAKDYLSMVSPSPADAEHYGVKGMRWGIRRDPKTGARPIAVALNESAFGRATQRNVDRYNRNQAAKAMKKAVKTTDPEKKAKALKKAEDFGADISSKGAKAQATKASPPKAPANEPASQKYNRLRTQIKTHGPNSLEPDELNFVNARTEAIAKVNKMNLSSPGWLTDTSKVVLQDTTKTLMKDLAKAAVKEYIAKPLIKSAIKGS